MHPTWIPFQDKVIDRLEPLLEVAGFYRLPARSFDAGLSGIVYQRIDPRTGRFQKLIVRATLEKRLDSPSAARIHWLRVQLTHPARSVYLKPLGASAPGNDLYAAQGWTYTTGDELDRCLEEIADAIQNVLTQDR